VRIFSSGSTRASPTNEQQQRSPRRRQRSTSADSGTVMASARRDAGSGVDVHQSGSTASGRRTHLTRNEDSDRPCGASRSPSRVVRRASAWE